MVLTCTATYLQSKQDTRYTFVIQLNLALIMLTLFSYPTCTTAVVKSCMYASY